MCYRQFAAASREEFVLELRWRFQAARCCAPDSTRPAAACQHHYQANPVAGMLWCGLERVSGQRPLLRQQDGGQAASRRCLPLSNSWRFAVGFAMWPSRRSVSGKTPGEVGNTAFAAWPVRPRRSSSTNKSIQGMEWTFDHPPLGAGANTAGPPWAMSSRSTCSRCISPGAVLRFPRKNFPVNISP